MLFEFSLTPASFVDAALFRELSVDEERAARQLRGSPGHFHNVHPVPLHTELAGHNPLDMVQLLLFSLLLLVKIKAQFSSN